MSTDNIEIDANTIIVAKRRRLAMRQDQVPANAVIALANMQKGSQSILTEVTDHTDPIKLIGRIRHEDIYDPVGQALRFTRYHTDAITLFTDNKIYSKGMEDLTFVSKGIHTPLITQDYILNAYHVAEARAAGASGLVIYASLLDWAQLRDIVSNTMRWRMTAIVQVNSEQQLADAARLSPHVIAIGHGHDFDTEVDLDLYRHLHDYIPFNTRIMPMGCLHHIEDVEAIVDIGTDALIVSESLLQSPHAPHLRHLLGREQDT